MKLRIGLLLVCAMSFAYADFCPCVVGRCNCGVHHATPRPSKPKHGKVTAKPHVILGALLHHRCPCQHHHSHHHPKPHSK